jgi:hypothetical protein
LEFSYRSKKDEDYYYDKDSGIDFIKEWLYDYSFFLINVLLYR